MGHWYVSCSALLLGCLSLHAHARSVLTLTPNLFTPVARCPFKEWLMNSQLEATRRNYQFRTGTESTTAPATSASFKSLRVLDLGCGTGQSCQPFIDHAAADKTYHYELVGLDTTQEVGRWAWAWASPRRLNISLTNFDILPFIRFDSLI